MRKFLPLLLLATLPIIAFAFSGGVGFLGEIDGQPGQRVDVTVTGDGEFTAEDYVLDVCFDDPHGPQRCGFATLTLPPPAEPPPDPPPPDPPPAGELPSPLASLPCDGIAAAAALLGPGEGSFVPCPAVASPSAPADEVVLASTQGQLEDAAWGGRRFSGEDVGKLTYAVSGENRQAYDPETQCWRFYGGGHGDSNLNHVIRFCIDGGWAREWGPGAPSVIDEEYGCPRPEVGPDHVGHMWGAMEWLPATDGRSGRLVLFNFMSYNRPDGCPDFPPEALQVWTYAPEDADTDPWTYHGANLINGQRALAIVALDGDTVAVESAGGRAKVRLFDDAGAPIFQILETPTGGWNNNRYWQFTYDLAGYPSGIIVELARSNSKAVSLIDPSTMQEIAGPFVPPWIGSATNLYNWGAAVSPDGRLWILPRESGRLYELTPATGEWRDTGHNMDCQDTGFIWAKLQWVDSIEALGCPRLDGFEILKP